MTEADENRPVESLLEHALRRSSRSKISLGEILDGLGERSFGPAIVLLALLVILPPLGGVPGFPALAGGVIIVLSAQMMFGREHPWLPKRLRRISFGKEKVRAARRNAIRAARWIDPLLAHRLHWAAGGPARSLAALCCILLSLLFGPLEVIPFAVALPASAVLLFGLGITARDGLVMLGGFAVTATSFYLSWTWLV